MLGTLDNYDLSVVILYPKYLNGRRRRPVRVRIRFIFRLTKSRRHPRVNSRVGDGRFGAIPVAINVTKRLIYHDLPGGS